MEGSQEMNTKTLRSKLLAESRTACGPLLDKSLKGTLVTVKEGAEEEKGSTTAPTHDPVDSALDSLRQSTTFKGMRA